jgi:hypothetical protein
MNQGAESTMAITNPSLSSSPSTQPATDPFLEKAEERLRKIRAMSKVIQKNPGDKSQRERRTRTAKALSKKLTALKEAISLGNTAKTTSLRSDVQGFLNQQLGGKRRSTRKNKRT